MRAGDPGGRLTSIKLTELAAIGTVAVALRIFVFAVVLAWTGISVESYSNKGDGLSYKRYAAAICGDASQLTDYDRRVFPGYPLLIAGVHVVTRLPFSWSALVVTWASAGVAASLAGLLFGDHRVGWAMVMLIPHYPINSSLAMGEAPLLAVTLAGLWLALSPLPVLRERVRVRVISSDEGDPLSSSKSPSPQPSPGVPGEGEVLSVLLGGCVLGFAGLVRPVACFAVMGLMLAWMIQGRWRVGLSAGAVAAGVVLVGVGLLHLFTGDALHGVKVYADSPQAYNGELFTWPMHSLIAVPLHSRVPPLRLIYIAAHVAVAFGACGLAFAKGWSARRIQVLDGLCGVWLVGNTLFVLCIGSGVSGWGFHHFPRFTIPAQPALFWMLRRWLPERRWIWIVLLIPLALVAVGGVEGSP